LQHLESATPTLTIDGVEFVGRHQQLAGTALVLSEQQAKGQQQGQQPRPNGGPFAAGVAGGEMQSEFLEGQPGGVTPVVPSVVALATRKIAFQVVSGDVDTLRA
jgi:hypothetical protein